MTSEDRQRILAELSTERAEIVRRLSQIDGLIEYLKGENVRANEAPHPTAPQATPIYSNAKTLFEMSKICLKSVNGAGLTPIEIADRLIEARAVGTPHGLSGHISTALKRRMNSAPNPETEIRFEKGRYYYRTARPTPPASLTVYPAQTMSKPEVCAFLGKSKRSVETYIATGRLAVGYFHGPNGKTAIFKRADLEALKRTFEEVWERNVNPVNQR